MDIETVAVIDVEDKDVSFDPTLPSTLSRVTLRFLSSGAFKVDRFGEQVYEGRLALSKQMTALHKWIETAPTRYPELKTLTLRYPAKVHQYHSMDSLRQKCEVAGVELKVW